MQIQIGKVLQARILISGATLTLREFATKCNTIMIALAMTLTFSGMLAHEVEAATPMAGDTNAISSCFTDHLDISRASIANPINRPHDTF
jgi:hypothetical protein